MSIIDTLITDRAQSDVNRWHTLHDRGWAGMTDDEKAEWTAGMRGAYNATDLNRVNDALIYLRDLFGGFGFSADIKLPEITDVIPGTIKPGESRLPDGYTELQYIESTGTQWIDTGITPTQDYILYTKVAFLGSSGTNVLGTRNSSNDTTNRFGIISFGASALFGAFYGTNSVTGKAVDQTPHEFSIGPDGFTMDEKTVSVQQTNFSCSYPIILFGFNNGANGIVGAEEKVYSCQIYDNGILVRDYVPAKNSGEVVGLYDLVNDTFYQNAGTGVFTAGPEIIPEPIITPPVITTRTNWTIKDIPTSQQMNEYLANVETIRSMMSNIPVYPADWQSPPETPETMQHLTYEQANDIERILTDINDLLVWVSNNLVWIFAGDVYAGEW